MVVFLAMLIGWLVNPSLTKKDYREGVRIGLAELILEVLFLILPLFLHFH